MPRKIVMPTGEGRCGSMVYRDPDQGFVATCSKAIYHGQRAGSDEESKVHRDQHVPDFGWYSVVNNEVADHPEDLCVDSHGRIRGRHFYAVRNAAACSVCGDLR